MRGRHRLGRWIGHLPLPFSTERIVRRLAVPEGGRDDFEVRFEGYRFRGNLGSYIDWSIFFFGAYAAHELALLDGLARKFEARSGRRPVFADVGANVGNHTLFMSRRAARVVAFEPSAGIRERLRGHLALNEVANVAVFSVALGDRDGPVTFHYLRNHANEGMGTTVPQRGWSSTEVEMRRGDAVPELADVDIIKIDVEGAEAAVLKGLAGTLAARKPAILMELSDASRAAFGDERGLRNCLYGGALIQSVTPGRLKPFSLRPFDFATADEILVTPPA